MGRSTARYSRDFQVTKEYWSRVIRLPGTLHVVIVGSPNLDPGYKLVNNQQYPKIAEDYQHGFQVLKSLPCDIFLGAHGGYWGLKEK